VPQTTRISFSWLPPALLALAACKGAPARLSNGISDSVIVNSVKTARLSVQVLDARGRELPSNGVQYRWTSGDSISLTADGRVTCSRQGDAEVRVSLGDLSRRLHVLCRPMRSIEVKLSGELVVGGAPQQLMLTALGVDSQPVTLVAGHATVRDTEVVVMRGLTVIPKVQGETTVEVELGDCMTWLTVSVNERVGSAGNLRPYEEFVVAPLQLVPGEIRSWRITPGVYDITLERGANSTAEMLLGTIVTNCIVDGGAVQHYHTCIARKGASVVVRHPQRAGKGQTLSGTLVVRRVPDPWSGEGRKVRFPEPSIDVRKPECAREMLARR
jgi:hypothetical protein